MKKSIIVFMAGIFLLTGCASFRSGIQGKFEGTAEKNFGAEKVSALFIFDHYKQSVGYDAIPKMEKKFQIIDEFDDLFLDALSELSNVGRYNTYTEFSSDVADPKRRAEKDSLLTVHDYIFRIKFTKENSFARYFLGALFSSASATILPIPYKKNYSVNVSICNSQDVLIKTYTREASVTKWVQSALIFIYPFYTEKKKTEEIYIAFMHDIFRQVEAEKVLVKAKSD